jgi:hypothetical protein
MKIMTRDMAISRLWKIHIGATIRQNIATNQYDVDLCDNIYISNISNMMIVPKYFT